MPFKQPPLLLLHNMRLFGWMHNKFKGRINEVAAHDSKPKQEYLLKIGTLGLPIEETEFTAEEVGKLLTKLVSSKPAAADTHDLPLSRFLNCPSTLELDRRLSNDHNTKEEEEEEDDIDRTIKAILDRRKDKKAAIGKKKKSVSFLFRKMLICGSTFPAIPGIPDQLPESRIEKLLRAMLKNKINNPRPTKHLIQEDDNGSKWVKTDSEYIVLEISNL